MVTKEMFNGLVETNTKKLTDALEGMISSTEIALETQGINEDECGRVIRNIMRTVFTSKEVCEKAKIGYPE